MIIAAQWCDALEYTYRINNYIIQVAVTSLYSSNTTIPFNAASNFTHNVIDSGLLYS